MSAERVRAAFSSPAGVAALLLRALPTAGAERLSAHVAVKFLVPVARLSLEDCQRMAAISDQHRLNTRRAGQLYAARRLGSPLTGQRILKQLELFFKAQRQVQPGQRVPARAHP